MAIPGRRAALRARLGRVGVWSFALQAQRASTAGAAVRDYEANGARATWIPESVGSRDALAHAAILLAATERMVIATGIANVYARDPMAMANGARALADAYPGRFVLGLGVSHAPSVATRGAVYGRPVSVMAGYLDAMAAAAYAGQEPEEPAPIVLAALGPRMLELAAERTDGAHSYFVPVEHTAMARSRIGPDALLAVELTAVIDLDRLRARGIAHAFARRYLALPNYADNLRRLGWSDDDLAGEGSERLIDAVIAVGSVDDVADRVRAHLGAGADHVCVQLRSTDAGDACLAGYRDLLGALADLG